MAINTYLKNYFNSSFVSDLLAGLTTAFAAIALGAAFGVDSGSSRGAFAGMIAAAIIPIITSIFGGTRLQASGPTAPMTTVAKMIIGGFAYQEFAKGSLEAEKLITLTIVISGLVMMLAGVLRMGRLIKLVPQMVLLGFMNGIALSIWLDQFKKIFGFTGLKLNLFGLEIVNMKPVAALDGSSLLNLSFTLLTLFLIIGLPTFMGIIKLPKKITAYIPATLFAIIFMSLMFNLLRAFGNSTGVNFNLQTVNVGEIGLALFIPDIAFISSLSIDTWLKVLRYAFQLALLGYLDSLLTSLVIDSMTKEETKRNKELLAQGLANTVAALFGGIPGAQATIRSVLLLKEGAKTRMAGVFVGIFSLILIFAFGNYIALVASAIFVGVLIKAGWDVFESDFFKQIYINRKSLNKNQYLQLAIIIYTTLVTFIVDLNIAVITGTVFFFVAQKYLSLSDINPEVDNARQD